MTKQPENERRNDEGQKEDTGAQALLRAWRDALRGEGGGDCGGEGAAGVPIRTLHAGCRPGGAGVRQPAAELLLLRAEAVGGLLPGSRPLPDLPRDRADIRMGACGTGHKHEAEEAGEPRAQPLPRRPGGGHQGVEKAERIPADANRLTTTLKKNSIAA